MKNIIIILGLSLYSLHAADINAVDGSRTEVNNALTSASTGDRIIIPAGSNVWSSGIIVTKRVTFAGSGSNYNGTVIQYGDSAEQNPLFDLRQNGIIISNMLLRSPDENHGWLVIVRSNRCMMRDLHFERSLSPIIARCIYDGLIYNSTFHNCAKLFRGQCDNPDAKYDELSQSVAGPLFTNGFVSHLIQGTTNFFVAENCKWTVDSAATTQYPAVVTSEQGAMWCVRHCDINNAKNFSPVFDAHGALVALKSVIAFQIYSNRISCTGGTFQKFIDQRGGVGLVYSNECYQNVQGGYRLRIDRDKQPYESYFDPGIRIMGSIHFRNYMGPSRTAMTYEIDSIDLPDIVAGQHYTNEAFYVNNPFIDGRVAVQRIQYPHYLREGGVYNPAENGQDLSWLYSPTQTRIILKSIKGL